MASPSRTFIIASIIIGGLMLLLDTVFVLLGYFQALDYLKSHWEPGYRFAVSDKTHFALLAVGVTMLGYAIWKLAQTSRPSDPDSIEQSKAASVLSVRNTTVGDFRSGDVKTGDVHVHIPSPVATPLKRSQPPQPIQRPRPNITFLSVKVVNVHFGVGGAGIYEHPNSSDATAIKACFRNESEFGEPTVDAFGIKAHVRSKDKNGDEIGEGASGVQWMGYEGDAINLQKDHSACVCCLLLLPNRKILVPCMKRVPIGHWGRFGFVDEPIELAAMPSVLEVRLNDDKGLLLPPREILVSYTNDTLEAKPMNDRAEVVDQSQTAVNLPNRLMLLVKDLEQFLRDLGPEPEVIYQSHMTAQEFNESNKEGMTRSNRMEAMFTRRFRGRVIDIYNEACESGTVHDPELEALLTSRRMDNDSAIRAVISRLRVIAGDLFSRGTSAR